MINPHTSPRIQSQSYGQYRKTIKNYSYFLNDKIGYGYSSTVYKGINDLTNQKVAIKVIQLKFIKDIHIQKLLQTQLECIRKINHRYLLKFIDTYQTNNNLYIITEYCQGGDLQRQLKDKGRFNQHSLIKFYAQFYQGYVNLFQAGFIHRDLKPANILIKNGKIRIADFGIVKKTNQNPKDNYNVGTMFYMAPQALLSSVFTQKSDVWAIGIMLYQLAHGYLPWKSNGSDKNMFKTEIQSIVFTYDSSWLSVDCIKFISRCLDKDPNTRIGIKQMLLHPWMVPVVKLINQSKLRNRKNKSQNTIPIDHMPGPGQIRRINTTTQNLSKFFSNEKLSSNSNMSINNKVSSLSQSPNKTPVLKFTYKHQNSNIINNNLQSKQDIQGNLAFQRMRTKITGTSIKILPSFNSSNNILMKSPQLQTVTYRNQQIQNYLLSIFSYIRYLSKSIKNIKHSQLSIIPQQIKDKIFNTIIYQLLNFIQLKQKIIKNGENIFTLWGWQQFKQCNKYQIYCKLINNYIIQYYNKYNKQFENIKNKQKLFMYKLQINKQFQQIIYKLMKIIQQNIIFIENSNNIYTNLPIFDCIRIIQNLIVMYNLRYAIMNTPEQLNKQIIQIEQLLEGWEIVNNQNYMEKWQVLKTKIQLIFMDD